MKRKLLLWWALTLAVLGASSARAADYCSPGGVLGCAFVSPLFAGTAEIQSGGRLVLPDGAASCTTPELGFAGTTLQGLVGGPSGFYWCDGSSPSGRFANNQLTMASGGVFGWTAAGAGSSADVSIGRSGTNGALRVFGGTTPTQSATTCGTGPTIVGNNRRGSVTLGTGPTLPCTIVFNGTWTNAPTCYLNPDVLTTATTTVRATGVSTTQFVITSTAALVATDKVSWLCESN